MTPRRTVLVSIASLALAAPHALADRPMGSVSSWGHELNQDELPNYRPNRLPVRPARWYRTMNVVLNQAGSNGLWFTGPSALPFPPLPLAANEPVGWRNHRNFSRHYRRTGLKWDVAYEVWAARKALNRGATVMDPRLNRRLYTQRVSLIDPSYRRAALAEIRRIAPRMKGRAYVAYYAGSDEPMIKLPHGRKAVRSPYARMMRQGVRRFGHAPPVANAPRRPASGPEGLRWVAYNRWVQGRFFTMKREQAVLIKRLHPGAKVNPNDYGFIRGFVPWDYNRLANFADLVETDPYVSWAESARPGRGRYNPGFAAKFMTDITGVRNRVVLQGFTYAGHTPSTSDLYAWAGQALRAGATDLSVFSSGNPRVTNPRLYRGILNLARDLRGTRLPDPPVDPAVKVVYATASEAQGQPELAGDDRYLASGDALYTAYGMLGEKLHGAFSFDSDAAMMRTPTRFTGVRAIWLPRADTLDRPFAEALVAWVQAGGTLIVNDPDAFTRTPRGQRLDDIRAILIGVPLGENRAGRMLRVAPDAFGEGQPAGELFVPVDAPRARAFADVPADTEVLARFLDDAPAVISRPVGQGRVIAFATDLLRPQVFTDPMDAPAFMGLIHGTYNGHVGHPAWTYRVPGDPDPTHSGWTDPGDEPENTD